MPISFFPHIPAVLFAYIKILEIRARGKWRKLPPHVIAALGEHYTPADLSKVRYACNVDTVHGMAITFEDDIYFPREIDITSSKADLHLLLHELEHVRQYEVHGGLLPFLIKYVVQGGLKILQNGLLNIHDEIGLEKEASRKADQIIDEALDKIRFQSVRPVAARFRAINDYASKHRLGVAFPNFHQADYGRGVVFGTLFINKEVAEWRDVPAAELGNPDSIEARFRAVNDYAARHGFGAAFPNFHQADYGSGVVHGTILLAREAVEWRDVPAAELGNPDSIEARFRAVNDYAARHGFGAAFPNFHQADYGSGVVYGVLLVKKEYVTWRDVPALDLASPYREDLAARPLVAKL